MDYRESKARQCQKTTKNSSSQWKLGESWKFQCQQRCLAKYRWRAVERHTAILGDARQNTIVLLMPTKSTRPRLEGAGYKSHQDHITAKGTYSITHYRLAHKFIPMPQAFKNSRCKLETRSDRRSKEKVQERSFCFIDVMDLKHLKDSVPEPQF